jgi:hypothetical protein
METKQKKRRVYPAEFKAEAAALAGKHEKPICQAAADLGGNENRLVQEPGWFSHKSSKKRIFLTKSAFFAVFKRLLFRN